MSSCCGEVKIGNIYAKYPELKGDKIMQFKALKGFDGVKHEVDGRVYTFFENKVTEAPESLKVHEYTIYTVVEATKEDVPVVEAKKGDIK